ncbi:MULTISPECIES: AMP-binding protein [Hyphomonas]|uniref:Acyl-CoA synthetase n=1 Tax=Hyphomonas adhaerens TaxID=81029 RepID=A0A3B9H0X3_9PROT|nr:MULTISPECIES: AMP-binding protein [Hyphomonas]MBB40417.1 acyl-CoA synthetase [Hyphomonas sp.]HAE28320.1 acyl-CoA synthetase [Hyphomonas adhaerens]|tara:strand:- start:21818 stop:23533 length:1716 start_codon:yes stop_codon:yes gene_type:complete
MDTSVLADRTAYLADLTKRIQASWPEGLPLEPEYPFGQVSVPDYLRAWADRKGDEVAIDFYGRPLSWKDLNAYSDAFASFLDEKGVGVGDRVAVFLPNCPQFSIAFFGILKRGAILVPVNPMVKGRELAHYLEDSGARLVLALDTLSGLVKEIDPENRLTVVSTALSDFLRDEPAYPVPAGALNPAMDVSGTIPLAVALATPVRAEAMPELGWDQIAAINYTGGTTGLPKGCLHTHGDMIYTGACAATYCLPAGENDVILSYLPQFWIAGEVAGILLPIVSGCRLVLLTRWDALAVLTAIDRSGVTGMGTLTDGAVEIMDHPDVGKYDLTSLRDTVVTSFVKILNPEYRARWKALTGAVLRESSFGMTETNTLDTFTTGLQADDADILGEPLFVGLPCPGAEFIIIDPDTGLTMPYGEPGEILVRTPSLMKGYWGERGLNADGPIHDGWLHTGDTGVIDEKGGLYFRGRRKEMLKVNGMSVFPTELEISIARHRLVAVCGVIGRPDEQKGQVPVAFVQLEPDAGEALTEESLRAWCRENMATYKVPEIRFIAKMPLTDTGKVKRNALVDHL